MTRRRRVRADPVVVAGGLVVLCVLIAAAIPGILAPQNPEKTNISSRLTPPGRAHMLGTDEFGRDILSRVIWGAQVSVKVGVIAVAIAASLGVLLGILAGYYGGLFDSLSMRTVDLILAFPAILLALVLITVLRPSIESLMLAMGIVYAPRFARLARGGTLTAKEEAYVEAARAVGASDGLVLRRHVLPNISGPLLVQATITLPQAILAEASLSFLGLGVQPPTPAWGAMLSSGRRFMETAPWVTIFPGLAIAMTALAVNFLGDALQDWANPRTRRKAGA
ncbi:MAG: ABC transporter permease [Armatimonadota bacterium]